MAGRLGDGDGVFASLTGRSIGEDDAAQRHSYWSTLRRGEPPPCRPTADRRSERRGVRTTRAPASRLSAIITTTSSERDTTVARRRIRMDGRRFDHLSRVAVASRRSLLASLAAAAGADLLSRLGLGGVALAACREGRGRRCKGCCRGGKCLPGITFDECGQGGETCQNCRDRFKECKPRSSGIGGQCVCSKRSCDRRGGMGGCCTELDAAAGTCQSGISDTACGQGGKQCLNCARQSKKCDPVTRKCCIALNERGCGANEPCCDERPCVDGRCRASSPCRKAGETCGAGTTCCSHHVLECRSGKCCALQSGVCQVASDCCNPAHTCFATACQPRGGG